MFVLVLAAEADETRQAVTLLIVCLVGIAIMLALLTVWYWLFTSPKRRAMRLLHDLGHYESGVAESGVAESGAAESVPREEEPVGVPAGPAILSESSELMSSMLAEAESPVDEVVERQRLRSVAQTVAEPTSGADDDGTTTVEPADKTPARPPRPMRVVSSAPDTIRRPDARPTGPPRPSPAPVAARAKPRPLPGARSATDDELAKARQRREKRTREQEGLSDDDWAAAMKSAFNHLNR